MAAIILFSSQTGEESLRTSAKVIEVFVRAVVPGYDEMPPEEQRAMIDALQPPFRKAAHALEFALLGFLLMLAWSQFQMRFPRRALLSLGVAVITAVADELRQWSVTGRGPSLVDIGIDALGAAAGVLIFFLISRRRGAKTGL